MIAVSSTGSAPLTASMVAAIAGSGMSCGSTASAPRRASVSAIRRPDTAVMLAAMIGTLVPTLSGVVRSTASRDPTSEREGTMKTSL